jgi:RimJ/RimL family protein N-acetyltransferase
VGRNRNADDADAADWRGSDTDRRASTAMTKRIVRSRLVGPSWPLSHWGGLYNGEMKRLMLRHAFQFVNRVIFLVGPQNLRSQRAVEKNGGVRAGRRLDASGRESLVYRIEASAFT